MAWPPLSLTWALYRSKSLAVFVAAVELNAPMAQVRSEDTILERVKTRRQKVGVFMRHIEKVSWDMLAARTKALARDSHPQSAT